MPTPDGRAWLTSDQLAERFLDYLIAYDSRVEQFISRRQEVVDVVKGAFADLYTIEFKIARLCEQLKDSIERGDYGPLYDDQNNPTQAGAIFETISSIYTKSVLDCYDENGNYIC